MKFYDRKQGYRNERIGARRNSMKLLPEFDEIRKIAETGKYQVLPVSCESFRLMDTESGRGK